MPDSSTDKEVNFIGRSVKDGRFMPSPAEARKLAESSDKTPEEQKKVVNRIYQLAKRGVQQGERAFLMCDMLGFSDMLSGNQEQLMEIYEGIILPCLNDALEQGPNAAQSVVYGVMRWWDALGMTINEDLDGPRPKVEVLMFADTIVMYPTFKEVTFSLFKISLCQLALLNNIARYLFVGMLERKILLRGSIGFGDSFISRDPICYLGKPVAEVHNTEMIQNWGGLLFAPSAAGIISDLKDPYILTGVAAYDVPIKPDPKSQELYNKLFLQNEVPKYVVDLTLGYGPSTDGVGWLREQTNNQDMNPKVRELYENTFQFYEVQEEVKEKYRMSILLHNGETKGNDPEEAHRT